MGVRREIVPEEAAVVERIFTLAARGHGLKTIAKALNDDGVPSPRPQQGRPAGWAPSSIREVLRRPLYRGVIQWNTSRKRDTWGTRRSTAKPEAEWVRIQAPELAVVPEILWESAHKAMAAQRARYPVAWGRGGPAWSREGKYLLTGLLRCAVCGASMEARPRTSKRPACYSCSAYSRKGRSVCTNGLLVRMEVADDAVISAVERTVLNPDVIDRAVQRAVAQLTTVVEQPNHDAELRQLDAELARLAQAVAGGGDVPALVAAMRQRETQRQALLSCGMARHVSTVPAADVVMAELREQLTNWRALFTGNPAQARGVLKQTIVGRLDMVPNRSDGSYAFTGTGTIEPLIAGVVPHCVASPGGLTKGGNLILQGIAA